MRVEPTAVLGLVATMALLATGCGDDDEQRANSVSTTESAPNTGVGETSPQVASSALETIAPAPTVTRPTTTTTTSTTTLPETTTSTTVPGPDLTLRADGLGEFDFGASPDALLTVSNDAFGAPSADVTSEYPVFDGRVYASEDAEWEFSQPVGRIVCWTGLCLQFGGNHSEATFVGWSYTDLDGASNPVLTNRDGVTIGSRWSDFLDALVIPPGGCYTTGYGQTADGISVVVAGGDFSMNTDDGTYVALLPDPSVVMVTDMQAGDHAVWVIIDC